MDRKINARKLKDTVLLIVEAALRRDRIVFCYVSAMV